MAKEAWEKFRKKEPTSQQEVLISCHADKRMFAKDFAEMPKPLQQIFQGKDGISIPCEGSGFIGVWCSQCRFVDIDDD